MTGFLTCRFLRVFYRLHLQPVKYNFSNLYGNMLFNRGLFYDAK